MPGPLHAGVRQGVEQSQAWRADDTIDPAIVPEVRRFVRWATFDSEAVIGGGLRAVRRLKPVSHQTAHFWDGSILMAHAGTVSVGRSMGCSNGPLRAPRQDPVVAQ